VLFGAPACKSSWKSCTGVSVEVDERAPLARVELNGTPRAGVVVQFLVGDDTLGEGVTDDAGMATPKPPLPTDTSRYTAQVDPFSQRGELRKVCPAEDSATLSR